MVRGAWTAFLIAPLLAACSGEPHASSTASSGDEDLTSGAGAGKQHPASSTQSVSATTGTGASQGGGGSGGAGGDADDLDLTMGAFEVPAGTESLTCQYFPPDGKQRWINSITATMSSGAHHLLVYRILDDGMAAYGPVDCTGGKIPTNAGLLPSAKNTTFTTPEGVAFDSTGQYGLYLQAHFINTTSASLHPTVSWHATAVEASTVKNPAGILFYNNKDIDIPPDQNMKITKSCPAPQDMQLFRATAHYHLHTTHFTANVEGAKVLDVVGLSENAAQSFDPEVTIHANDAITWTCFDQNQTPNPILFGPSLTLDEMCQFIGYVYPVADSATYSCP